MMDNFFPALLLAYLQWLSQGISKPNRVYFQSFIWALLIVEGRKYISRIAEACFFMDKSLSSFERFLAENQWDLSELLKLLVKLLIKELDQALKVYGQYLVALDTILIGKASKKMLGVQKFKDHSSDPKRGGYQIAHQWMVGALLSYYKDEANEAMERFLAWPIVNRLVSGQKNPMLFISGQNGNIQANFWHTAIATALQMKLYLGSLFRVVVDSYFCNISFLQPMVDEVIGVISRLRKDAVGWDDPPPYKGRGRPAKRGRRKSLKELIETFPTEAVSVCLYGKVSLVDCVVRDVWLRNLSQKVRVVVIKGKGIGIVEPVILLSTDSSLSAKAIIEIYGARFSLEIAFRDLKEHLGYSDYQSTTTLAFYRFVHLCCIAFCL